MPRHACEGREQAEEVCLPFTCESWRSDLDHQARWYLYLLSHVASPSPATFEHIWNNCDMTMFSVSTFSLASPWICRCKMVWVWYALERLRQEDLEFKNSFGYTEAPA